MPLLSRLKNLCYSDAESSSATPSAIPDATTPEQFLERTKACEDRLQGKLTRNADGSMLHLRINYEQCKYVAGKLKLTVRKAEMFLTHLQGSPISKGGTWTNCLYEFKLLQNVACAVENFIENCCKDEWVAAAFRMPNMAQDVLPLTFDLALLAYFFSGTCMIEVEGVYRDEASGVTKIAANDRRLLSKNVKALLRTEEKNSAKYQLAELLLKRLETPGAYRTDNKSFKKKKKLGKGAFAKVYKSTWLGLDVAVKTYHAVKSDYDPSSPLDFQAEVSIVGGLSHPNLASMYCYAEDDRECSIVMELMDDDLSEMIGKIMEDRSRTHPFSIIEAVNIMLEVGKGVEYLHEMKIVHRDLKAANILVKQLGNWRDGESRSMLVKVADFGLSKTKEKSTTYSMQTFNTGTPRWMAPEVIQMRPNDGQEEVSSDTEVMKLKYPRQSDVHSFGMVCYEILTGRQPYFEVSSSRQIRQMILRGDRPKLPEHCFPKLKDLIERCWSEDASKRPRFGEICAKLRDFRFQLLLLDMQQKISPQVAIKLHGEAQIVVGLDIGTRHSGYAFAHRSKPQEILTFSEWPEAMKPYCKTATAIYYEPGDPTTSKVKSWGWEAVRASLQDMEKIEKLRAESAVDLPEFGTFCWVYKSPYGHIDTFPEGLSVAENWVMPPKKVPTARFTVTQVIADYLREIGASILRHLRTKFSDDITMADVQWCVTVPSMWNDDAKNGMQVLMVQAGLVRSANSSEGSPHPVSIVLESEAASCYCHRNLPDLELKVGDRLLVANIGGVTRAIVVQERMSETLGDYRVKAVENYGGALGGLIYLDWDFFWKSLCDENIFFEFLYSTHSYMGGWEVYKQWEEIKCSFGDRVTIGESFKIQLPSKLAAKWEEFDQKHAKPPRSSYDEVELTHADMEAIFEPCVERILHIIAYVISRKANLKVILVVGGIGGSPYLLTKIKERFLGAVENVMSPMQPESAFCKGAVMLELNG